MAGKQKEEVQDHITVVSFFSIQDTTCAKLHGCTCLALERNGCHDVRRLAMGKMVDLLLDET